MTQRTRTDTAHNLHRIFWVFCSAFLSFSVIEMMLPVILPKVGLDNLKKSSLLYELNHIDRNLPEKTQAHVTQSDDLENIQWMDNMVIHPYLGYVTNPQADGAYNNFGFPGTKFIYKQEDNTVVVGVFGGSVAWFIYWDGKDELINQFTKLPQYRGKKIEFISVALGGYKQPQQLLALNYILSLGGHFDVIINVDGFNEAALPYTYNFVTHITPYYPQHWDIYSQEVVDVTALPLINSIKTSKSHRYQLANIFNNPLLKQSHISLLVWNILNQRALRQLNSLNAKLVSSLQSQGKTFQVQGSEPPKNKESVFDESLNVWRESSLQMARIALANGIRYYHVLQPNQYVPNSKPMSVAEKRVAIITEIPDDTYLKSFYRYQEAIETLYPKMKDAGAKLALDHGIAFFDMTQLFSNITEPIYIDACCHYNKKGTQLLIQKITDNIATDLINHPTQKIH